MENTFGLLPATSGRGAHVTVEEAYCGTGIRESRTNCKLAKEGGEREGLDVKGTIKRIRIMKSL